MISINNIGICTFCHHASFNQIDISFTLSKFLHLLLEVLESCVNLQAKHHINASRVTPVIQEVACNIFGQDWKLPGESTTRQNFNIVLPSKHAISNAVEDATILSLKKIGEEVVKNSEAGGKNTLHFDDTMKKSGSKMFDTKTVLITTAVQDEEKGEKTKKSHSLGFVENLSHKAADGAESIKNMLSRVAVLIGVPYDEFLQLMDYSMTDRGGDVDALLDELGIDPNNRLKCNAHILLCIDASLNKVLKDLEIKAGVQNLLGQGLESTHVLSSSESVWTLGLIAFSKLLASDNSVDTISLHHLYIKFLEDEMNDKDSENQECAKHLLKNGFTKFVSNRFGRLASLSKIYIQHKNLLEKFFSEAVDEHSNRLWMASYCYLKSEWFYTCCKVATKFHDLLVEPIMRILGIDDYKFQQPGDVPRTWNGVKLLFNQKLHTLQDMHDTTVTSDAESKILKYAALNIKQGIERQLSSVDFFTDDSQTSSLENVPLTNSCSESNFGKLNHALNQTAGSFVDLKNVSNRNIIQGQSSSNLTSAEKLAAKIWSRRSPEAKEYKKLVKEYQQKVKNSQELLVLAKKEKKRIKMEKAYKLLDQCKVHGGPISPDNLEHLDNLTEKQLILEIRYLRITVAPNIRERRKLRSGKFERMAIDELKNQIVNVLNPPVGNMKDLNNLFKNIEGCNKIINIFISYLQTFHFQFFKPFLIKTKA